MRTRFSPRVLGGLLAGAVALALAGFSWSAQPSLDRAQFQRPKTIPHPDDNPYSEAKAALGRMLFFDPVLSGSQKIACASCHDPSLSWQDGRPRGIGEKIMPRRSPTLLNIAWVPAPGWAGQFEDLENVAFTPISSPIIMNLPEHLAVERLSAIPGYVSAFTTAFGNGPITKRKIELALATYERSIVSKEAPFDRWIKGDERAISSEAKRGFSLFVGKANCVSCHSGWAFTDASFHDIGTAKDNDIGRSKLFPSSVGLRYAFKTPTLRDVAKRPPYMHDGSLVTLEEVLELYSRGGIARPSRDPHIHPLNLSTQEKSDLIAFLRTLNSDPQRVAAPQLPPR